MIQQMDHSFAHRVIDKNTKQTGRTAPRTNSSTNVHFQHDSFITVFIMKKRIKKAESREKGSNKRDKPTHHTLCHNVREKEKTNSITKTGPIKEE